MAEKKNPYLFDRPRFGKKLFQQQPRDFGWMGLTNMAGKFCERLIFYLFARLRPQLLHCTVFAYLAFQGIFASSSKFPLQSAAVSLLCSPCPAKRKLYLGSLRKYTYT